MQADLLIHADWVIPVESPGVLEQHSIAVTDGRITAITPRMEAQSQIDARESVTLPGHALIPGLINGLLAMVLPATGPWTFALTSVLRIYLALVWHVLALDHCYGVELLR